VKQKVKDNADCGLVSYEGQIVPPWEEQKAETTNWIAAIRVAETRPANAANARSVL
jgi:hypothetical protein